MAEQDTLAAFDAARISVVDALDKASQAEGERDGWKDKAEALQKEKDDNWASKVAEVKKQHPGDVQLLKMMMAATRDEWVEVKAFMEQFDGHLPVGLVRVAEGCDALLAGANPDQTAPKS